MPIDLGSKAPDFTLMNQDRQPVTLSAALGEWSGRAGVLSRPRSAPSARARCARFAIRSPSCGAAKAQVFGVSTDTFFALKAWSDQQRFGFPLLSDYNKEVIRSYGVVNPDMIGLKDIAKRAVFVIDPQGIVRHKEVLEDARNEPDYGQGSGRSGRHS